MNFVKDELDSLTGTTAFTDGVDRRVFLMSAASTALGAGFASAVLPVTAQTMVKTDDKGLTVGEVKIAVNGQELPVYRALPQGKADLPVVLVVSEIFGVHEHIADVARRFARQGYLALAPELFFRQGDPRTYSSIAETMRQVVAKVPDEQVMNDLDACLAWAAKNGGNADTAAITGFCWGGRITWLYCARNPKMKAGVAWYGRLAGDKSDLTPRHPLDTAQELKVPVLGLYGAKDQGIPLDSVGQMREALDRGGSGSEIVIYPESGHAFHADYRPSYVEADAKDGWIRCLAWFKRHGLG